MNPNASKLNFAADEHDNHELPAGIGGGSNFGAGTVDVNKLAPTTEDHYSKPAAEVVPNVVGGFSATDTKELTDQAELPASAMHAGEKAVEAATSDVSENSEPVVTLNGAVPTVTTPDQLAAQQNQTPVVSPQGPENPASQQ